MSTPHQAAQGKVNPNQRGLVPQGITVDVKSEGSNKKGHVLMLPYQTEGPENAIKGIQ